MRVNNNAAHSKPENVIRNAHPLNGIGIYFFTSAILHNFNMHVIILAVTDLKSSRTKKKTTPSGQAVNSVTSVLFQTDTTLISSGASNG